MPEVNVKRRYEILYRKCPAWLVPDGSGLSFPDDYAGKVIAVRPVGHKWTPGDLKDRNRQLKVVELTTDEANKLRSRELKADGSPVTFDDRWGRVAAALRERFSDPEAAEIESREPENEVGRQFGAVAVSLKKALPKTKLVSREVE